MASGDRATKIKPQKIAEGYTPETFRVPGSLSDDGTRGPAQVADFGSIRFVHGSRHVSE